MSVPSFVQSVMCFTGIFFISFSVNGQGNGNGKVYALIIGVNKYDNSFNTDLRYANLNADNFYQFIKSGIIPKKVLDKNITLISDSIATWASINAAITVWLEQVVDSISRDDVLYIYWTGHGRVWFSGHQLMCKDTKPRDDGLGDLSRVISFNALKEKIRRLAVNPDVNVYLIVDACRNHGMPVGIDPRIVDEINRLAEPGETYFYGCQNDASSYVADSLKSNVFTYFFLLGIMGAADESAPFGKITAGELFQYVSRLVGKYVSAVIDKNHKGDVSQLPHADLSGTRQRLVMTNVPQEIVRVNRTISDQLEHELDTIILRLRASSSPLTSGPGTENDHHGPYINEEETFVDRDTLIKELYDNLLIKINQGQLVKPAGITAEYFYNALLRNYPDSPLVRDAKYKFFMSLIENVQELIDLYLDGKLKDTRPKVFWGAYHELDKAIGLVPLDTFFKKDMMPRLLFLEARALAGSNDPKDWSKGIQIIDTAIRYSRLNAQMYHTKGMLFSNKSRYFTALRFLDSAIHHAPNWIFGLYNLAYTYHKIQEYDLSLQICDSILIKDSTFSWAWSLKATNLESIMDYSDYKDYSRSVELNLKALQIDPTNAYPYYNLGRIYSKLNSGVKEQNLQMAKGWYSKGAEILDDDCMIRLGDFYLDKEGKDVTDSAKYYYKQALAINPFNYHALKAYSLVCDTTTADSLFQRTIVAASNDYKVLNAYKYYLFHRKSVQLADQQFEAIINSNNEDPAIFIEHSKLYEDIDSLIKSRNILLRGLSFIPKSPSLLHAIARLFFNHSRSRAFSPFAIDSSMFYSRLLRIIQPDYSINNFNLHQLCILGRDHGLSERYLGEALKQNKYVGMTDNFSKDLVVQGDIQLKSKKYKQALKEYNLTDKHPANKISTYLKIATAYYHRRSLDSATAFYNKALNSADTISISDYQLSIDTVLLKRLQQLHGLIELEYRNRDANKRALMIFKEMDISFKDLSSCLEQAVCFFLLNDIDSVKKLATQNSSLYLEAEHAIANNNNQYSEFFLSQVKKMVASLKKAN